MIACIIATAITNSYNYYLCYLSGVLISPSLVKLISSFSIQKQIQRNVRNRYTASVGSLPPTFIRDKQTVCD